MNKDSFNPLLNEIILEDFSVLYDLLTERVKSFNGVNILITGASGMLGSYHALFFLFLVEYKNFNLNLILTTTNYLRLKKRLGSLIYKPYLKVIESDTVNSSSLNDYSFEYIIHAASLASPHYYSEFPVKTILPNIIGTYNLLEIIRNQKNKLRSFAFVSSLSVNGQFESEVLDENTKSIFRHLETEHYYGASKLAGELLIKSYSQEYMIPGNFVRLGHTLGPGLDYLDDTRIFSNIISSIMNKKEIEIHNPNSRRVFTYIADVLQGIIIVLTSKEKGEPFIIVNEENDIRIGDLVTTLGKEYNLVLKCTSDVPLGYVQSSNQIIPVVDTSKIRRLGWKPSTNVLEGFHRTIKYYKLVDEKNE